MRINLPLFAHNCNSTLTPDSAVIFNPSGQIKFPSVNRCITVAGVNSNAVPGASILLRKCDEMLPFLKLQHFNILFIVKMAESQLLVRNYV